MLTKPVANELNTNDEEVLDLNSRLAVLLRNLDDAVLLESELNKVLLVNQSFCDLFSMPNAPNDLQDTDGGGVPGNAKLIFKYSAVFTSRLKEILDKRERVSGEIIEAVDGRVFERQFYPIFLNETYKGHLWKYKDITHLRNVEKSLNENKEQRDLQEQRFRNALDVIKDALISCSWDGEIQYYNAAFLRIFDIKPPKEGVCLSSFLSTDEYAGLKQKWTELYEKRETQTGVLILPGKHLSYTLSLPVGREKELFICTMTDISEVVNKENSLNSIIEKQRELNSEKSRFIRITSHELRTPLSIIKANAEIFQLTQTGQIPVVEQTQPDRLIHRIVKEVGRITHILDQLMTVSRIETGNIDFTARRVDVLWFLTSVKEDFFDPYPDGRHLILNIEQGLGSVVIDIDLVKYALVNLLGNAFKYSLSCPAPELTVRKAHNAVVFEIRDYGIGIPPNETTKLFESFYRASNVGQIQGTGLGLMITEYAVKKHGGEISLTSELNKGSIFTITLPQNLHD